ncbi:hypothetical protein [Nostoc sp. ChiVER01]|uniref:hypothetical protein n=1 Tax=Nostoc sp. ChiVER01 TaxID=3075382 RepID=UPI002AD233C4|nr:hypothetical protein [Nostoc sp. ChiVER01]MDZ8227546.1 hypothetical protein [Nostoc sp. ChiVER01]
MNKYADITKDLQLLESTLQRVLQSPVYADMVRTGLYNPDLSLLDALHAVQQFTRTSNHIQNSQLKTNSAWRTTSAG